MKTLKYFFIITASAAALIANAQENKANQAAWQGKFEQLDQALPTPNSYRSASGAPGVNYWQQRADYVIDVELNDDNQLVTGSETITYYNNSPEDLKYLWLQLDQNLLQPDGIKDKTSPSAALLRRHGGRL